MDIDYTTLQNSTDFEQMEVLRHEDLRPFILRELKGNQGWGLMGKMYQGSGLLLLGFALIKAFAPFLRTGETAYLAAMGWGLLFCFTALIVVHELIHYVAYLAVGARRVSFGANLRKFIFYVQADRQVLNYKQFKIVALAPALLIALLCIIGAIAYFEQPPYYFFLTVLAMHSLFCIGDWAMLCFFENRTEDEIYTFDVKSEQQTYFFKRKQPADALRPEDSQPFTTN